MTPYRNYGLDEWINYHLVINKQEIVTQDRFLSDPDKKELIGVITDLDKKTAKQIWEDEKLTDLEFPGDIDKLDI